MKPQAEDLASALGTVLEPWMHVFVCGCAPQLITSLGCSVDSRAPGTVPPQAGFDAVVLGAGAHPACFALPGPGALLLLMPDAPQPPDLPLEPLDTGGTVLRAWRLRGSSPLSDAALRRELARLRSLVPGLQSGAELDAATLFLHSTRERNGITRVLSAALGEAQPPAEIETAPAHRSPGEIRIRALHFRAQTLALAERLDSDQWMQTQTDGSTAWDALCAWNRAEQALLA